MHRQRSFFDEEFSADMEAKRLARRDDPPTSHEAARELVASGRLSRQCQIILDLLEVGPCSSSRLAGVAQNNTARISDLRRKGYAIEAYRHDGEWWYRLER